MRRMACWVYEGLLLFGVVFMAGYVFGTLSQTRNALDNRHALQGFVFVVFAIYFTWFWSQGRRTLPMKTMGVTLVQAADGKPLSERTAKRYMRLATQASCLQPTEPNVNSLTILN